MNDKSHRLSELHTAYSGRLNFYFEQTQLDAKFWLFAYGVLIVHRILMLAIFSDRFGTGTNAFEIIKCIWIGARFDAVASTYWTWPFLLMSIISSLVRRDSWIKNIRTGFGMAFIWVTLFIQIISIGFFAEFNDHFNHWIFGMVYDDAKAVIQTIWKEYNVIMAFAGFLCGSAMLIFIFRGFVLNQRVKFPFQPNWLFSWKKRTLFFMAYIILITIATRGALGRRPLQLRDAAITRDAVLNKLALNPYFALLYAVKHHLKVMRSVNFRIVWNDSNIQTAIQAAFPGKKIGVNLDATLERTAQGPPASKAQHIFLIVMESYDAWPVLDRYAALQLSDGARSLAKKGILIPAFISAGWGTMPSVGALITGLPEADLVINYQTASRKPFPTSIAAIFRRLGYRTRAFYAGYSSWQRFSDFCYDQGFDEVHCGGDMDKSGLFKREWGVEDDKLFDYVSRHITENPPSFNFILTAGYHKPYTIDVFRRGYPVRKIPEELSALCSKNLNLVALGHLWFADHCMSHFVKQMSNRFPLSVFAVTGDHSSRRFINESPNAWERYAVLMLWYGPYVLPSGLTGNRLAGSHLDILPTLIELAAHKGFNYHAFGRNLFDLSEPQIGFGSPAIMTPEFVIDMANPQNVLMLPSMIERPIRQEEKDLIRRWQAIRAASWWRTIKGPHFDEPSKIISPSINLSRINKK